MLSWFGTVRGAVVGSSLLALLLRLVYLIESSGNPFRRALGLDMEVYDLWAKQILGGTAPAGPFLQAPLFPYILAMVYNVVGEDPVRALYVQLVPSVLAVAFTAAAAGAWRGPRAAWGAGVLLAVYVPSIFYTGVLLPPAWALALSAIVLFFAMTLPLSSTSREHVHASATKARAGSARRSAGGAPGSAARVLSALAFGGCAGLLALAQPTAATLALIPLLTLSWIYWRGGKKGALRNVLLAALVGLALPIAGTFIRNASNGAWTPIAVNSGINLYIGNGPDANGAYVRPVGMEENRDLLGIEAARRELGTPTTAGDANRFWTKRALQSMTAEPARAMALFARKLLLFFGDYEVPQVESLPFERRFSLLLKLPLLSFGVLLGFAVLGAVRLRSDSKARWIAASALLFALAVCVYFVTARFRIPIAPWLAVLGGAGLADTLTDRGASARASKGEPRFRGWALPIAAAALAVIVSYGAPLAVGIDRDAAGAQYIYRLGALAEKQGDVEEAILQYRTALDQDSTLAKANLNLGTLLARRGELSDALPLLDRAARLDPTSGIAHQNLGQLHEVQGRLEEARRAYEAAVAAEPALLSAQESLAYVLYRQGDVDASRDHLLIVMRNSPEGSPPRLRSGTLHAVIDERRALAAQIGGKNEVESAWWKCRPLLEADVQLAQRRIDEAKKLYADAARDPRFAPYAEDIQRQMTETGLR